MKIESGLFDHMVLQQSSHGTICGTAQHNGTLIARVTCDGKTVRGFANKTIGKVRSGKLTAAIKGLAPGGPYHIELRIIGGAETLTVSDVLVGDVWIAAGQSNMQGCGLRPGAARPHPMVRAFYCNDQWKVAKDPIHNLWQAVDPIHGDLGMVQGVANKHEGVGPAVAFAQDMHKRTGVPQGIIAAAHGGTSMEQWDPKLRTANGSTLYRAMMRRAVKNGGKVAGVIWYQGESDAGGDAPLHYTKRMASLVSTTRRDLKSPALPWAVVQIGRVIGSGFPAAGWNSIQDQQRLLPKKIKYLAVVPAIDLTLDDAIHIAATDQQRLGRRLAYAMDVLLHGTGAGKPPITLRRVTTSQSHPTNDVHRVTLHYDNVVESLRAGDGRASGFAIVDAAADPVIYKIDLDGNKVHVCTTVLQASLDRRKIAYGHWTDPMCNIIDGADRSLPVMEPQAIGRPHARTGLACAACVAMPVQLPRNVDGKLNGLKLPRGKRFTALPWRKRTFDGGQCDMHTDIQKLPASDFIVYYAFDLDVPEPMKLLACIGYDGPVKVWIDGKEKFHDPDGTNPACEDSTKIKWSAAKGRHQIVIALGSNQGRAWGVFLRIERSDLSLAAIRRGGYVMATFRRM